MRFKWGPEFELGIEKFDFHHRKLIELINRLYDTRTSTGENDNIVYLFDGFSNYCNYRFTRQIRLFSIQIQNRNYSILPRTLEFFKDWLTIHIQEEDRKYVRELKNKINV